MVYCSRKCQIFSTTICALIWAAVFIVAMLVPYIILRAQNEGVKKLVVIDRDTWTQKQWDNYTVSTLNMSYYLWNATNLDAVMRDTTGATLIKWQEVGPFNISKISHMEPLSGESASSGSPYLRYRKLTTYKISDEATKKLLSKPIVAINTLWVGALSRAAQSLYAGSVQATPGLTPEQKLAAIRANLYPQAFNKESLFYGALTQGWLSGAAVQFTAMNASGYTPESALIPALRILSIGSYLDGARNALGSDPAIISIYPDQRLNITAPGNKDQASQILAGIWGAGQSLRNQTIAQRSTNPAVRIFQDFELPAKINTSSIVKAWNVADLGATAVALVTVPGLRNWGVALQCVALGSPTKCSAQQAAAFQLITSAYGADFSVIAGWLASPLSINLLDTTNVIKPTWKRTYTQIGANTYAYIATTPAERFQQIILTGFQQALAALAGAAQLNPTVLSSYGFDPTAYTFAPSLISEVDGTVATQRVNAAANQIQSFYDLALLQYATGWVVGLALPTSTTIEKFQGITVSRSDALGPSAGFGAQLNIDNEPIEFSAAVQMVDPTLPVKDTRLTVQQADKLLQFIQGRTAYPTTTVTQAIIIFGLVSEAAIRVSQKILFDTYTGAVQSNNTVITGLLPKYLQLRTSAILEGVDKLSLYIPAINIPAIWARAKLEINATDARAFLPALPLFILHSGINETTGAGIRPFIAYFHTYFHRLQGGVGPIEAQYVVPDTTPGSTTSADSVTREGYNPVFGVSRRTNGLFIQRTAFEFLFGGRSHLPNAELNPILSPVTSYLDENYREYDGGAIREGAVPTPGANPIMLSAVYNVPYDKNTLEEAKKRNAIVYQGQDTAVNTGRMDINAVGQYHVYNGMTRYNSICQYNNPGKVADTIRADETSRIPGETLRTACVEGSAADYKVYDNDFYEEVGDRVNDPGQFQPFREGDSNIIPVIGTFITEVARTVTFNYTGVVQIKGINLRRYQLDSKYLFTNDAPNNPYKNAIYRQTAKPGFYPDTPDGMVSGWYYLGAPIFVSKPHFYQVSPQVTSAFAPGSFNPETPIHETYLDVDALSGKTMHARKRLQANVYVSKDTIDASPHLEPIFKSGDKFFPYYWAQEAGTITDDDAETFKTNIYKARDIGRIIQIVVGVISAILFVICVALVVRSCTKTPDATTTDK